MQGQHSKCQLQNCRKRNPLSRMGQSIKFAKFYKLKDQVGMLLFALVFKNA